MNLGKSYPIVLSIAGSDSSGGAGIQADLKTFSALGVYGATAITAITAQNTLGVHSQCAIDTQMVYDQIVAVIDDLHPTFVKIGMLSNVDVVNAVVACDFLRLCIEYMDQSFPQMRQTCQYQKYSLCLECLISPQTSLQQHQF